MLTHSVDKESAFEILRLESAGAKEEADAIRHSFIDHRRQINRTLTEATDAHASEIARLQRDHAGEIRRLQELHDMGKEC